MPRSEDPMKYILPPSPPDPPTGPYWLRFLLKRTAPFPPFPDCIVIVTSSISIFGEIQDLVDHNFFDKIRNMAYENHRAFIRAKGRGNNRQMTKIHVIRRLIEYKEPRLLKDETRERDKPLLSFGQAADC